VASSGVRRRRRTEVFTHVLLRWLRRLLCVGWSVSVVLVVALGSNLRVPEGGASASGGTGVEPLPQPRHPLDEGLRLALEEVLQLGARLVLPARSAVLYPMFDGARTDLTPRTVLGEQRLIGRPTAEADPLLRRIRSLLILACRLLQ
jgi:hypothetical protein